MRTSITADTISSAIGRPVRMFNSVCSRSRTFDRRLMKDSAEIIRSHGGSAIAAVHPGFYLQDGDRELLIAGVSDPAGKKDLDGRYEGYMTRFENCLSSNDLPLLLMIEEGKGLSQYSWVFDHAKPPLTLVIETTKPSFLPAICEDVPDESLLWIWTASTIRFELGIKNLRFSGEYLFINGGIRSGCVSSACEVLARHVVVDIDTNITFPNSARIVRPE